MAKHIHIHLHRAPVKDAGFDESKHKRADDGKFSTSGGDATHHEERAAYHRNNLAEKGSKHEDSGHHQVAMEQHLAAAASLREAQKHHENKVTGLAKKHHEIAGRHAIAAQTAEAQFESNRKAREAKYPGASKPGPDGKPMGIHPALAAAAASMAANPKTAPARHEKSMVPAAKSGADHHTEMMRQHVAKRGEAKLGDEAEAHQKAIDLHRAAIKNPAKSAEANAYSKSLADRKPHMIPGADVFTSHRNTPFKATYLGPDRENPGHHDIRMGRSLVSVPEQDLHPTRAAAHAFNQSGKK